MSLNLDGDLFDLANSLAGLMGAPITIEDRDTVVLAYSGGQQDVDEARIGTILGRQVPVHYRDAIAATGVFEKLRTSDEVIVLDLPEEHMVARAVIPDRNDNRLTERKSVVEGKGVTGTVDRGGRGITKKKKQK